KKKNDEILCTYINASHDSLSSRVACNGTGERANNYESRYQSSAAQRDAGTGATDPRVALPGRRAANKSYVWRNARERSMDEHDGSFHTRRRGRGRHWSEFSSRSMRVA